MVTWLIEQNVFFDQYENELNLAQELRDLGYPVQTIDWKHIFDPTKVPVPEGPFVFLGSLQLAKSLQKIEEFKQGIWMDLTQFDCTRYYPRLWKHLLNQDYVVLPYGDLIRQESILFEALGEDDALFIRPNGGDKLFAGKLILRENWKKDVEYAGFYNDDPENLVVVARPQNVIHEWRFFVVDRKVVAGSRYYINRKLEYLPVHPNAIVLQWAQETLDNLDWVPQDMFVMDVCETKGGRLHVLEIGSFSCSAQYATYIQPLAYHTSKFIESWWQE